jgi:hypothetical protein
MDIEKLLKEKQYYAEFVTEKNTEISGKTLVKMCGMVVFVEDATSICKAAIKDAKIEELRLLRAFLAKDATNIIPPSTLWLRIKQLESEL